MSGGTREEQRESGQGLSEPLRKVLLVVLGSSMATSPAALPQVTLGKGHPLGSPECLQGGPGTRRLVFSHHSLDGVDAGVTFNSSSSILSSIK